MEVDHLPLTSGIYQIRHIASGKVYVGSALRIRARVRFHRMQLVRGDHSNAHLLRAWRKHGPGAFECSVLELVSDRDELIGREQEWMDRTRCASRRFGFNICPTAGSNLGHVRPVDGYITPDGREVGVPNVPALCAELGLNVTVFGGLAIGRVTSYRGWSHANAKPKDRDWQKTYDGFIDPTGKPVGPITNLEAFARAKGVDPSSLIKVATGKQRHAHGWTHRNARTEPRRKREYEGGITEGFIDPSGIPRSIQNFARFCRENGLDESCMSKVRRGVLAQHHGWRHVNSRDRKRKLPVEATHEGFIDPQGNRITITNLQQFCAANGLSSSGIYRLKRGDHQTYKGWRYARS